MTRAFLNTRGHERRKDYQFLGSTPEPRWWEAYRDLSTSEQPTALVESDESGWRLYLSGIPSSRRDAVGTPIRFTVVLERDHDDETADPDDGSLGSVDVVTLVGAWLGCVADDGEQLSTHLDEAFPEDVVERLLDTRTDEDTRDDLDDEVDRRLCSAVSDLPLPERDQDDRPDEPVSWLADIADGPARAAFVGRVDELLDDVPGRALVLNLVGAPEDLAELLRDDRPLRVLAPDTLAPGRYQDLRPRPRSTGKKAPAPARRRPGAARRTVPLLGCLLTTAAVLAVGAAALLWWIY